MSPFFSSIVANALLSLAIILSYVFIRNRQHIIDASLHIIVLVTIGSILGIVFFVFFPEIFHHLSVTEAALSLLVGIVVFAALELLFHWHHCNDIHSEDSHHHAHGKLMYIGTFLHNMYHGLVLYLGFSISYEAGVALSFAIGLHALPQNIVNALMNRNNLRGLLFSAFGGVLGVIVLFPVREYIFDHQFFIVSAMAGGLLYIALSDVVSETKHAHAHGMAHALQYLAYIVCGVMLLYGYTHTFISHEDHEHHVSSHEEEHDHE